MNIQYQDLSLAENRTIKMYIRNPHRSISATYRTIRSKSYVSFFGDYPILFTVVTTFVNLGKTPSRFQVTYALNQSDELQSLLKQEKNSLLDQLTNPIHVPLKLTLNCPTAEKNKKVSNVSAK